MEFKPRRSSPRLPSFEYRGGYAYHLILTTRARSPRLADSSLVIACLDVLARSAARYAFDVVAYCFMPDHLHLLVVGSDDSPLIRFVQHFKQMTGHRHPGLWQRSYYGHVLRSEEAEDVALYIWDNPVRAGLVEDILDYAHSGPRERMLEYLGRTDNVEDRAEALSLRSAIRSDAQGGQP